MLDRDNPRSLAWVAHTLRARLAKLAGSGADQLSPLALRVPDPTIWSLAQLCEAQPQPQTQQQTPGTLTTLMGLLQHCRGAAFAVSEEISTTYFTHSLESNQSLGT